MPYDREAAAAYAHRWAHGRNPNYMSFNGIGGDCTNFISQCLYAGGAPMVYVPTYGWYYVSTTDRAPAWSGVEFLYNFLHADYGAGPFAYDTDALDDLQIADVIQLAFRPQFFSHTLLVVARGDTPETLLTACHSDDSDYRPLSSFSYMKRRLLRINVR